MAIVKRVDGDVVLYNNWNLSDVHEAACAMDKEITDDQAEDVLHIVADSFDANIGINWIVIQSAIELSLIHI